MSKDKRPHELTQEENQTVKRIQDTKLADQARTLDRNNQAIHEKNLAGGKVETNAEEIKATEAKRNHAGTMDEFNKLQATREHTISLMEGQNAPREEINRVKDEFNRFPVSGPTLAGLAASERAAAKKPQLSAKQVNKRPKVGVKYEGKIISETKSHYIQAVKEASGYANYEHRKQSFGRTQLNVGDSVSIKHMSQNTAIAVQMKPVGLNTPGDGMSIGKK